MTNYLNITWRNVIDSYAPNRNWFGHIKEYLKIVKDSGYIYFNWNGNIYKLIATKENLSYEDTGLTVDDLQ